MRPLHRWSRRTLLLMLPLLAMAFVGAVWLSSTLLRGARVDLTEHRQYTLSPGTLRILARIPEPITLQLYWSEQASQREPQFRIFAQRVRELLEEVAARSNGKLTLRIIDRPAEEVLGQGEHAALKRQETELRVEQLIAIVD